MNEVEKVEKVRDKILDGLLTMQLRPEELLEMVKAYSLLRNAQCSVDDVIEELTTKWEYEPNNNGTSNRNTISKPYTTGSIMGCCGF